MIRSIIALATLLLLTPIFVFADCGRRVVVVQQQPVKKVVVANHHAQKVVVVQKLVAVKVYDDHHYYSLDPYYQQQALAAQIVKQLRAELNTQKKQGGSEQPAPEPEVVAGEPVAGEYQNEKLLAIVNNSCAKCHGSTSKQTKFVTKDGKALAKVTRGKAWEAFGLVNSGEMPKAADNLDDEAVKLFYEWAKNTKR